MPSLTNERSGGRGTGNSRQGHYTQTSRRADSKGRPAEDERSRGWEGHHRRNGSQCSGNMRSRNGQEGGEAHGLGLVGLAA